MTMACLDTSFLVDLLRGKKEVETLKDELDQHETTLVIASPSIMELWSGACRSSHPEKEQKKINELLQSFLILPLDSSSAKEAAEIEVELLKKGQMIETEDIMIAGIARSHGEKIVTRDEHFQRIKGLQLKTY